MIETTEKDGKKSSTRRKRSDEELKQIGQLAAAAIGLDTQRGDLLSLENLSFQDIYAGNSRGADAPGPAFGLLAVDGPAIALSRDCGLVRDCLYPDAASGPQAAAHRLP